VMMQSVPGAFVLQQRQGAFAVAGFEDGRRAEATDDLCKSEPGNRTSSTINILRAPRSKSPLQACCSSPSSTITIRHENFVTQYFATLVFCDPVFPAIALRPEVFCVKDCWRYFTKATPTCHVSPL
jgi:hypothetical protein